MLRLVTPNPTARCCDTSLDQSTPGPMQARSYPLAKNLILAPDPAAAKHMSTGAIRRLLCCPQSWADTGQWSASPAERRALHSFQARSGIFSRQPRHRSAACFTDIGPHLMTLGRSTNTFGAGLGRCHAACLPSLASPAQYPFLGAGTSAGPFLGEA